MKAYIFTNDHRVTEKKVSASKLSFYYRSKLYDIDPTRVLMDEIAFKRGHNTKPRLVYFENSAEPLIYSDQPVPDPSGDLQEKYLKLNAVRTQNKPSFMSQILPMFERLGGLFTLENFIIFIVAGSMAYSALVGAGIL